MFEHMTEAQARASILESVKEYWNLYHKDESEFCEGQPIPYASRNYDYEEMDNLVETALDFWLTAGRYTDEFEREFARYLNVKYCSLTNSGSSSNLLAFMALTSPLLGDRRIRR